MSKKKTGVAGWVASGLAWGLAGGLTLGTLVVAPSLAPISDYAFNNIDSADRGEAKANKQDGEVPENPEANSANALLAGHSKRIVEGTLEQRPYIIVRAPNADEDDVKAVESLAQQAGATAAGQITLTDKFLSQDGADELRSIVANTLPAGAQLSVDNQTSGTHAGESLGTALMFDVDKNEPLATVEDRALVLHALRDAGFIEYADGTITPAQGIIVVTGGSIDEGDGVKDDADVFAATVLADLAKGLDSRGDAVVLAGRRGAAGPHGSIELIRSDAEASAAVSTVDSLDTETGRISTILALAEQLGGKSGAYGSASNAQAPAPERPRTESAE
ncbi:copper transporter [Corynebacterium sp. MSK041]|uniref:copper transporter n=1 Tax=Corynebacterium sp. MSK041 TaxID=3050194 RepID=UPI00254D214E|nr:copper transporter [Corynebacterium sp. MSK041]MDK8794603.1 copper transporter [Corynebacterium sp. MSK041]